MQRHTFNRSANRRKTSRRLLGFTLIELMVVVAIMVLIASMTIVAVNLSINNDKVRAGARQVQSYLAGARDRAIYSKAPRGVRFLLDPTNNRTVSSMVYIAPTDPWKQGTIQLERLDANNDGSADNYNAMTTPNPPAVVVRGFDNEVTSSGYEPTEWVNLYNQGLLTDGMRIRIPADDDGTWYTITNTASLASVSAPGSGGPNPPRLRLTTNYLRSGNTDGASVSAFNPGTGPTTYLLELPPTVMANQDPVLLPRGCVVHLDRCTTVNSTTNNLEQSAAGTPASNRGDKLPDSWKRPTVAAPPDPSGFDYNNRMDVLFSPRGVVIGQAAQRGIIHFYICDQKDADTDRQYWASPSSYPTQSAPELGPWTTYAPDPTYERGDKVILSLFTRTGAISTHNIFSNSDPFKNAETGEVAGK